VAVLQPRVQWIPHDVFGVALDHWAAFHAFHSNQQPTDVSPEEAHERAVRVLIVVRMMMMLPMDRDPMRRRVLDTASTQECEAALKPEWAGETAMREKPMKAEINPKHAENIKPSEQEKHPCPTEEPGENSERGNQVNGKEAVARNQVLPRRTIKCC